MPNQLEEQLRIIKEYRNIAKQLLQKEPDKDKRVKLTQKIAYMTAKSKIRSGIRTEPDPDEILDEMVKLLKEQGIHPIEVLIYDVDNKKVREDNCL